MRSLVLLAAVALVTAPARAQLGTILDQHKISSLAGGFAGPLDDWDQFGLALAPVGDLDGDGLVELAVGAPGDDDGAPGRGAVWILFLAPSGSVRAVRKISSLGGFPAGLSFSGLGESLAPMGDMDGDGIPDLAIGAYGAVWLCMLNRDGTVRIARSFSVTDAFFSPPLTGLERFAQTLVPIGDIDGNGVTDLAVGCPRGGSGPVYGATLWLVRVSRFGAVAGVQLLANGVTGPLAGREFAWDLAAGDPDQDGDFDLVTSATYLGPNQGFSLLELILDANHNLVRVDDIRPAELELYMATSQDAGSIAGLAFTGDRDGDGGLELLLGLPSWRPTLDTLRRRGAMVTAFTRPIGPARRAVLVGSNRGGFVGALPESCAFGYAFAPLGDVDGDGVGDLAVGAPSDPDGGTYRGAVWILELDGSPLRNGSGANPMTLSEAETPVMGQAWHVDLDCGAHAPGLGLLAGYAEGQAGTPSVAGEVLVAPASMQLFRTIQAHTGGAVRFTYSIPADAALISLPLHVQGMCGGAPGPRLSNALDEVLCVP